MLYKSYHIYYTAFFTFKIIDEEEMMKVYEKLII